MKYRSTRSNETVTANEALLKGLASDGGLYVPENLPKPLLSLEDINGMDYKELANYVLSHFLTDIPEEELGRMTGSAYTGTFDTEEIVPVKPLSRAFPWQKCFMEGPVHLKIWRFHSSLIFLFMRRKRKRIIRKSLS